MNDLSLTPDATNEEINVAKALVEKLLNQALTQINQDKTTNQVNLTEQQGVKAINDVQVNVVKRMKQELQSLTLKIIKASCLIITMKQQLKKKMKRFNN